jgi:hypothetical protein
MFMPPFFMSPLRAASFWNQVYETKMANLPNLATNFGCPGVGFLQEETEATEFDVGPLAQFSLFPPVQNFSEIPIILATLSVFRGHRPFHPHLHLSV